jgi:hypothetical protein
VPFRDGALRRALRLVKRHWGAIRAVARALLERGTLTQREVAAVIAAARRGDGRAALYVPRNLDLTALPPAYRDSARYVLNLVHWRGACGPRADDGGYVHLVWDYLTTFVPRHVWPVIRDWLTDPDRPGGPVLLWDRRFAPGEKSYGYALAEPYRKVRRVVCRDERLNRKIRQYQAAQDRSLLPVHHWLRENLDLLYFEAGLSRAIVAAPDAGRGDATDRARVPGRAGRA